MNNKTRKYRVTWSWAILLITLAVIIDIAQAILEWVTAGISDIWDDLIIDPLILVLLWFIFRFFLKINFTKTRAFVFFALGLLEFIPVAKEFPLWTLDVIAIMLMATLEDRVTWLKALDDGGMAVKNPELLKQSLSSEQLGTLKSKANVIMKGVNEATRRIGNATGGRGASVQSATKIANSYDSGRRAKIEAQKARTQSNIIDAKDSFKKPKDEGNQDRMAA